MLVADGSATQILMGLLVCFIFILLLGNLHPYPQRRDDILAQAAQIQLFLTLLAALIVKVRVGGVYEAELFSWCVIAANCATIALALFIMLSNLPCTACIADATCVRRACPRRCAAGEAAGEAVGEAVGDVELVDIVICDEPSGPAAARRRRRSSLMAPSPTLATEGGNSASTAGEFILVTVITFHASPACLQFCSLPLTFSFDANKGAPPRFRRGTPSSRRGDGGGARWAARRRGWRRRTPPRCYRAMLCSPHGDVAAARFTTHVWRWRQCATQRGDAMRPRGGSQRVTQSASRASLRRVTAGAHRFIPAYMYRRLRRRPRRVLCT